MNKTVNINLAGILFHIDEDAFIELQKYLESLQKAFANEEGAEEIIADIEARIAEIFNENKKSELQVINLSNVHNVITVMGTPEELNEEEEPKVNTEKNEPIQEETNTRKQLYRDTSDAYISGVSSGISHYFEINVIWVRLAWLLLVLFSGGTFFLLYLSLWFFVPEAKTTAEKLAMKGKSVNINNIEQKIKEGLNNVADSVKNVYEKKNTEEFKSKSVELFEKLGCFLGQIFKIIGVFIGLLLMFISGTGIIAVLAVFLGTNVVSFFNPEWINYENFGLYGIPVWISSLLIFITASVPLVFLFILGLKIAFRKIKKISKTLLLSLIGIWILAIIGIIITNIIDEKNTAHTASSINEYPLAITSSDTLHIKMQKQDRYVSDFDFNKNYKIRENENGEKVIVSQNLKIYIENADVDAPSIKIKKQAKGSSYNMALANAENIDYNYKLENNNLVLDAYSLGSIENKFMNQKVKIFLSLPKNCTIYADRSTNEFNNNRKPNDFVIIKHKESHYLKLQNKKVQCVTCTETDKKSSNSENNFHIDINLDDDDFENELEEKIESFFEKNYDKDHNELEFNGKKYNVKINEYGIQVNTKEN